MRNKYPGRCRYCRSLVRPGEGYRDNSGGRWHTAHYDCCPPGGATTEPKASRSGRLVGTYDLTKYLPKEEEN